MTKIIWETLKWTQKRLNNLTQWQLIACVEGGNQVFDGGGGKFTPDNLGGQKLIGAQSQVALMGEWLCVKSSFRWL